MAGVTPKKLVDLTPDITNALLTVLVISKTEPTYFLSRDPNSNEYRGVINYTVRDTKRHLVNCKYWGSKEKVEEYHRTLKIGDIIDVICPRVAPCSATTINDMVAMEQQPRFQPLPTLPIILVLNEGQSILQKHDYRNMDSCRELWNLSRVPHKPLSSVLQLADVRCAAANDTANYQAQFVDLLVAVANKRPVKQLRSIRTDKMLNCLELVVLDSSYPSGMILSIWSADWIKRAEQYWQPLKTVLHLIDVRVSYSDFYHSPMLSLNARSLIYENPIGKESDVLMEFAATVRIKDFDIFALTGASSLPDPESINTQMTVKQIYTRAEGNLKDDNEQFTAVVYAMVTKFDIDGQSSTVNKKCKSCQRILSNTEFMCNSEQCQLAFSFNDRGDKYEHFFNINIQFSDHTGTLTEARLSGAVAERILKVSVDSFMQMSEIQKEELKWRLLMEYFEVKIQLKKVTAVRKNLAVIVVDMRPIDLGEYAKKITVY